MYTLLNTSFHCFSESNPFGYLYSLYVHCIEQSLFYLYCYNYDILKQQKNLHFKWIELENKRIDMIENGKMPDYLANLKISQEFCSHSEKVEQLSNWKQHSSHLKFNLNTFTYYANFYFKKCTLYQEMINKQIPNELIDAVFSYSDLNIPLQRKTIEEINHINNHDVEFNFEELVTHNINNYGIYDPQITLNLKESPCKREIENVFINVIDTPDEDNYYLNILPDFHEKIGLYYPVFPKNGENRIITMDYEKKILF